MADLETIQSICLSFKAATEDIKWENDLVFSIGGKMFCVSSLKAPYRCSFKVKDEEFEELCQLPQFSPAPYMARAKWVAVTDWSRLNQKEWQLYLKQSYKLVKAKLTKKQKAELGLI